MKWSSCMAVLNTGHAAPLSNVSRRENGGK